MPYLVTPDEIPIHYQDEGPKTTAAIFLIHAGPFSSKFWQKNIPELCREFRVVAIDLRGYGDSGKTDEGHSFAQYARDCRFVWQELHLEKVISVGWSIGAAIILNYMQQFGNDRLAGYINVDQPPYWSWSEEYFAERIALVRTHRLMYHRERLRAYLGPQADVKDDVLMWMACECMKTPTSTHIAALNEAYRSDYRPFLREIRVPTRVFWARYGNITRDVARFMSEEIQASKLVIFERSGHLLPWTEPHKFNDEVASFARVALE